jgi:hypothetical protein
MSRNLCTDRCPRCGHGPVTIADLSGKPIEFRYHNGYVPQIGARWDCPGCRTAYFAMWHTRGNCIMCAITRAYPPGTKGTWEIDLSYWSTYNDEIDEQDQVEVLGLGTPRWLLTSGCEHLRFPLSDLPEEADADRA